MNNIAKYRGLKGITQKDFAEQIGMTRPGLSFIENGYAKNIDSEKIEKMSKILGVSPITLLGMDNLKCIPDTKEDVDYMIEILNKLKESL